MLNNFRHDIDALTVRRARFATCALALVLAFACVLAFASPASADVRKSDLIAGKTVEERSVPAINCPSIDAEHAILIDDEGTVYFERDAHSPAQIASITKTMTAIVALEYAPSTCEIVVSEKAASVGESSAELRAGDVMTLDVAVKALMMPSGNDAAYAIAECVGALMVQDALAKGATILRLGTGEPIDLSAPGAAYDAFVSAMNVKAKELGCTDTVFTNPHGLDDGEWAADLHSTAFDVALFVAHAMKNEVFRGIVATDAADITVKRDGESCQISIKSTDALLGVYEGACGVKTGYTDLAGACFAGAVERDGKTFYSVVLHSTSEQKRFEDTTVLWDWAFKHTVSFPLASSPESTSAVIAGQPREVPIVARVSLGAWIDKTVAATFADPDAKIDVFALRGNVSQAFEFKDITGSVKAGDVVGRAVFYQNNVEVASQDLIACEDAAAPGAIEGVGIWWDRLFRSFSGEQQRADSVVINETPLIYDKQTTFAK